MLDGRQSIRARAVLAIGDDAGAREMFERVLRLEGLHVESAATGAAGIALAAANRFDLALVDLHLPDMSGMEAIRRLRDTNRQPGALRLVLVGGSLTTAITVEAMKAGAANVIEKPVSGDELVRVVASELHGSAARSVPPPPRRDPGRTGDAGSGAMDAGLPPAPAMERPASITDRWALLVVRACESPTDLKTLEDWATCVGMSYSSLRESCHLVGIRPHDARDLTRMLRAVVRARRLRCGPEMLLDVCDSRTLAKLLTRAGFRGAARPAATTPAEFLASQRFVGRSNAGLQALGALLARAGWL